MYSQRLDSRAAMSGACLDDVCRTDEKAARRSKKAADLSTSGLPGFNKSE
jgi:hypothetical protein